MNWRWHFDGTVWRVKLVTWIVQLRFLTFNFYLKDSHPICRSHLNSRVSRHFVSHYSHCGIIWHLEICGKIIFVRCSHSAAGQQSDRGRWITQQTAMRMRASAPPPTIWRQDMNSHMRWKMQIFRSHFEKENI